MSLDTIYANETSICDKLMESPMPQSNYEFELIIYGQQGYIIWGIIFVVIAFLGCIGNIVTIIILFRDPIMSSLNVLLIALAISDLLAPQANALLAFSFYHLSNKYANSIFFLKFNDILRHIIQPLSTLFTMCSSWIVTTTTLFRLIAVVYPFRARTLINKRFTYMSLLIIFSFSLISIIPLYASLYKTVKCTRDTRQKYLAYELKYTEMMGKAYLPTIQIMCFYLPWIIALVLWIFLLKSLRKSERSFQNRLFSHENSSKRSWNKNNSSNFNNNGNLANCTSNKSLSLANLDAVLDFDTLLEDKKLQSLPSQPNINLKNCNTKARHVGSINKSTDRDSRQSNFILFSQSNSFNRTNSCNKITLMVSVLCFTNLMSRLFTFVFIFEIIYNEYLKSASFEDIELANNNNNNNNTLFYGNDATENGDSFSNSRLIQNARTHFPIFLSYSLLFNNIFLCINHSSNIIIYTFTNPRFRRNLKKFLKQCLCCIKCKCK